VPSHQVVISVLYELSLHLKWQPPQVVFGLYGTFEATGLPEALLSVTF
jgi:hypothetical protein